MGSILTITLNAAIDATIILPDQLTPGEIHRATELLKLPGGKGINVARVLQTLGLPVCVSGFIGGAAATFIKAKLQQAHLCDRFFSIQGQTRTCYALFEPMSGRTTEIYEPGAEILPHEAEGFLASFSDLLQGCDLVIFSGSLPRGLPSDYYAQLMKIAHMQHIPTILDTSGAALTFGLAEQPLLIKPNHREAAGILGYPLQSQDERVAAGQLLQKQGAQLVALTCGEEGAILVSAQGSWLARLPAIPAISSVGSGDAFLAGFSARLWEALQEERISSLAVASRQAELLQTAFVFAVACGSANTLSLGAGRLQREDIDELVQQVRLVQIG
ncbi:1-phosphofructokinase family hexose kinase [Tengunoibacter tsumagoiensis]|uniref:Tagatose-6-phosphate kinase n=1 Tax=Tengunoibacter tsumagoiensis TaxID=2014871 RepID=A0A402A4C9_9CHLR|nr:1-phosphofructokinase family hexose kinase [Tengunoibacter tsumagoiensis]GCE13855.1 tagatose-6-phosphate kinase [Tengunoibacter tsumagoiensis]